MIEVAIYGLGIGFCFGLLVGAWVESHRWRDKALDGTRMARHGDLYAVDFDCRTEKALVVAFTYGQIDGVHHKTWVIDQMVRALTRGEYADWVRDYRDGDDGPETYDWHEGTPP